MRRRIARQYAFMHRDAGPGDALHVGHRCVAVEIGAVKLRLADNAEDAGRRRMARGAGGDRRFCEQHAVIVNADALLLDRDDGSQRALRLRRFLRRRVGQLRCGQAALAARRDDLRRREAARRSAADRGCNRVGSSKGSRYCGAASAVPPKSAAAAAARPHIRPREKPALLRRIYAHNRSPCPFRFLPQS